jgi:hypothetical protein
MSDPKVNWKIGDQVKAEEIRNFKAREGDLSIRTVPTEVLEGKEAYIRKDAALAELLEAAREGQKVDDGATFRLTEDPLKRSEGATLKITIQKPPAEAQVLFYCETWDERTLRIELEISRRAKLESI